ncbi:glycosyltransferase family 2 protein [Elusimicrobiota bacterium]
MNQLQLSVIMPVFNEADGIKAVVEKFHEAIFSKLPGSEMILINDGSKDSTARILDELGKKYSYIRVVHNKKNIGHGASVISGFSLVKGDHILLVDSDDQIGPGHYWEFCKHTPEYDAVLGYRLNRRDPLYRKSVSRLIRLLNFLLFGVSVKDANCPFKLIKREALNKAMEIIGYDVFAPSLFLAVTLARNNNVIQLPVAHKERTFGTVSLPPVRFCKSCLRSLKEVFVYRFFRM